MLLHLSDQRHRQTPITSIIKQQPALCAVYVRIHFSFIEKVQLRVQAFIAYYSDVIKFGDFLIKNNIVNALTQYVCPKDSAESLRNAAKLGRIIENTIKK